jgi:hypothetical protein
MNYTTTSILLKLDQEREENIYISKELFEETILWIDRFKTFPEIEFDLLGNDELFINFLEANKSKIEETIYVHSYATKINNAATEEEAGVVEGFIEIEDEEDYAPIQTASVVKKSPTITITFDELYNMFSHMKGIVDEHTHEIAILQKQIDQNVISKRSRLLESPAVVTMPQIQTELPPMPPPFQYEYPQDTQEKTDSAPIFSTPDVITEEPVEEQETVDYNNYEEIEQQAPTATDVKPKISKGKKIAVVAVMLIALALFVAAQFALKTVKTEAAPVEPPATVSAVIVPEPMQNISTATLLPQRAVQPVYEPAAPEAVKPVIKPVVKPEAIETKPVPAPKAVFKYTENMKIYVKADHDNTINLKKGEQVEDIQGQDTENWNFTYKPFKITFSTKISNIKNIIIIKTNKTTYKLNLISSNKGTTLIDLSNQ